MCLSLVVLATIGVKMTNFGQSSSIGLAFSNIEALAADGEAGAHGKNVLLVNNILERNMIRHMNALIEVELCVLFGENIYN